MKWKSRFFSAFKKGFGHGQKVHFLFSSPNLLLQNMWFVFPTEKTFFGLYFFWQKNRHEEKWGKVGICVVVFFGLLWFTDLLFCIPLSFHTLLFLASISKPSHIGRNFFSQQFHHCHYFCHHHHWDIFTLFVCRFQRQVDQVPRTELDKEEKSCKHFFLLLPDRE